MFRLLVCLVLTLFVVETVYACFANCNGCTCQGTCGYPHYCMGVGPDCYCSAKREARDVDHEVLSNIIEDLCGNLALLQNHKFVIPFDGNHSLAIECLEGGEIVGILQ